MKTRNLVLLAIISSLMISCYPTRIVTVSPVEVEPYAMTNTTVTVPKTHVVTHTTQVYADHDFCLGLDLQAVAAAFAQSSTVREFEILLNNSSYMISNLDLNGDGYIDYLRVIETVDRFTHYFVIQAVLGMNVYQDVATIVVDNPSLVDCYVEVIGDPFIYGPRYIVRPVFIARPAIYAHLVVRGYTPWSSPWYWGYYPSHYKKPRPVYLTHYEAYVHTFIVNHHYCHEVTYPTTYRYENYTTYTQRVRRNDYGNQHPEQEFTARTANMRTNSATTSGTPSPRIVNARDVRRVSDESKVTTTTNTGRSTRTNEGARTAGSTTTREATTSTSTRTSTPTSAGTSTRTSTSSSDNATTTTSRTSTSSSGNATTTSRTNTSTSGNATSTTSRTNTSTAGNASTSTRTSSSATTGNTSTRTSSSSATRSNSSSSSSRNAETTTVQSRVRTSGTANTSRSTSSSSSSRSSSGAARSSSTSGSSRQSTSSSSSQTSNSSRTSSGSTSSTSRR